LLMIPFSDSASTPPNTAPVAVQCSALTLLSVQCSALEALSIALAVQCFVVGSPTQ